MATNMGRLLSGFRTSPRRAGSIVFTTAGLAAILVACGGGGGGGSNSSASTSVTYSGAITGFGSVIVNGTRFDDRSANVTMDDDNSKASPNDLRLGMTVEITGDRNVGGATGRATHIRSHSYAHGPVASVDSTNGQLTVLGLLVFVTPTTVFDGAPGLAALATNDFIEVYGLPDQAGNLRATRIEKKSSPGEVRLVGIAQNADPNADTFTLYGNTIAYQDARLDTISGDVTNGMLVRIRGTLQASGDITASRVGQFSRHPSASNGQAVEIEGIITQFDSDDSFEVNGLPVHVPATARREGGVAIGLRVEVEGTIDNGILVADKVELKDEDEDRLDGTEVHSVISSIDTSSTTFTLRNGTVRVRWNGNTTFDAQTMPHGAASLAVGRPVEVKGRMEGDALVAARIKLDD